MKNHNNSFETFVKVAIFKFMRIFALMFIVFSPAGAFAADAWSVVSVSGDAVVERAGVQPISVTQDLTLEPGDRIDTGVTGRVVLRRGSSTILIAPKSSVGMPAETRSGFTRILQDIGTALFKVDRRKEPHFEVQTPHLAAVVKGTTFTVNATP